VDPTLVEEMDKHVNTLEEAAKEFEPLFNAINQYNYYRSAGKTDNITRGELNKQQLRNYIYTTKKMYKAEVKVVKDIININGQVYKKVNN
jgi:hypothetical protein